MDWWRILHMLSLAWLGAGLGATYPAILRAWATKKLDEQAHYIKDAADNEVRVLVPGAMLTGITGFFWAVAADFDFFRDAWLTVLLVLYVLFYLVCLPLLGFGLRRARTAVLIAQKKGEYTQELKDVMNDNVPLVFSTLLVASVPILAWLAVFKPF